MVNHQLRLHLDDPGRVDEGAMLAEQRRLLSLTVEAVAERLLLSTSQVRGLESNSAAAFYNLRFFERAHERYRALLERRDEQRPTHGEQVELSMTFDSLLVSKAHKPDPHAAVTVPSPPRRFGRPWAGGWISSLRHALGVFGVS